MSGYRVPPKVSNPTPGSAAWQRQVEQNLGVLSQRSAAQQGYRPPRRANGIASPTMLYDPLGAAIGRLTLDGNSFQLVVRPDLTQLQYPVSNPSSPDDPANYISPVLTVDFNANDDENAWQKPATAVGVPNYSGRPVGTIRLYGYPYLNNLATGTGTAVQVDASGQLLKASSSERYKQDINRDLSLSMCIDLVEGLRPASFRYKEEVTKQGESAPTHLNFIAEDVDSLGGEAKPLVYYDGDQPEALEESAYKVVLTKVIQHLLSENRFMSKRIARLEEQLASHR